MIRKFEYAYIDYSNSEILCFNQNTSSYEVSYPFEMRIIKYGKTTAYDPEE
jgi:hypothetical protein